MPIISWIDLQRLTRTQLFKLLAMLTELLAGNNLTQAEREAVLTNVGNICRVLARNGPQP